MAGSPDGQPCRDLGMHGIGEKAYQTASTPLFCLGLYCCRLSQALDKVHSGQTLEEAEPCRNLALDILCGAEQWRKPMFSRALVSELNQKQEEKTLPSSVSLQNSLLIRLYVLLAGK